MTEVKNGVSFEEALIEDGVNSEDVSFPAYMDVSCVSLRTDIQ